MKYIKKCTVILLFITASTFIKAQNPPKLNNLAWYSFVSIVSHKKWYWQAEVHERHLLEPVIQHQFVARYALYRELGNNFSVCAGITYLAHNTFKNDILQGIFPHTEVEHREKINKLNITHNYRLELRFFDDSNVLNVPPQKAFYYHNVRIRYRLQLNYPILRIDENRKVFFRIFDEIHLNAWSRLPNNGFNHNRLYGGFNINATKSLNTNIGFMYWLQQSGNQVFTHRKIYWIGFTHRIAK
jgi:hypothetical protein